MSKNTSSEIKLTPTAPAALPALKGLNLQVFVMIAAIVVIMLFFTWVTDGAYLSARNLVNQHLTQEQVMEAALRSERHVEEHVV